MRVVLRLKPGDGVILVDPAGRQFEAQIIAFEGSTVDVMATRAASASGESQLRITVVQGFLKEKKMDKLVRVLTELGVSRFVPVICSRSVARPPEKRYTARLQRWQRIVGQAMKQCRRSHGLEILPAMGFKAFLDWDATDGLKLLFWERQALNPLVADSEPWPGEVILMLGPEGGFSKAEVELARAAGFVTVGLGPRILRAETATLAAVVMTQYLWGDMGQNLLDNKGGL